MGTVNPSDPKQNIMRTIGSLKIYGNTNRKKIGAKSPIMTIRNNDIGFFFATLAPNFIIIHRGYNIDTMICEIGMT
jgi:hypothetical protein